MWHADVVVTAASVLVLQVGNDIVLRLEFIKECQMKVRTPQCDNGSCCSGWLHHAQC
jgi:hypothetical protein